MSVSPHWILRQFRSILIFCILSMKNVLKSSANCLLELHVGRDRSWFLHSKLLHIPKIFL